MRPSLRIGLFSVAEGEQAGDAVFDHPGRLTKAKVEFTPSSSSDVGDKPIEDGTVVLVLVQSQVKKVAKKPSALRSAKSECVLDVTGARIALFAGFISKKCDDISGGQQTQPCYRSTRGGINDAIYPARFEPRLQVHVPSVGHYPLVVHPSERPLVTRDNLGRSVIVVLNGEHGFRVVQVIGGIRPVHSIGQQLDLGGSVGLEGLLPASQRWDRQR